MFGKKNTNKPEAITTDNLQVRSKFFLGNMEMELKTRKVKNAVGDTITIQYIGPVDDDR